MLTIYTIGHSTHSIEDFLDMLHSFGIKRLIDIRTVPGSRHNPQFGQKELQHALEAAGIGYTHLPALGGLRKKAEHSVNMAWRNESFRNFADYMQTEDFAKGIAKLLQLAKQKPSAIMCAEALPWRCHRSLVGDVLLVRGVQVLDIMGKSKASPHVMTRFAKVEGEQVRYPVDGGEV